VIENHVVVSVTFRYSSSLFEMCFLYLSWVRNFGDENGFIQIILFFSSAGILSYVFIDFGISTQYNYGGFSVFC
jgi:hypothetical protein